MGLIGPRKEELEKHERPESIFKKEWVICDRPTSTLTKGRKYQVLGHFCYLNRKCFDNDHWWEWDQFITIKNDEGWTIKVNLINFTLVSKLEKKAQEKANYENNPLNILMEANGLIPQKYV